MNRATPNVGALLLVACLVAPARGSDDDSGVGLADLEAYRAALAAKPGDSTPRVAFKDLWDRPGEYIGRIVEVEGRVARLFGQPKVGEFPALVEAWAVSPAGDPLCLVFPQVEGRTVPEIGASIRFVGTFLKRIKYQGGDVARLAPLIVGPAAPSRLDQPSGIGGVSWSSTDWTMALGGLLVVGWFLTRRHVSRPHSATRRPVEPPPLFVDGGLEEAERGDSHDHD